MNIKYDKILGNIREGDISSIKEHLFSPYIIQSIDYTPVGAGNVIQFNLLNVPTENNILITFTHVNQLQSTRNITPPDASWNLIHDSILGTVRIVTWWKLCNNSEPTDYIFNISGSNEYHSGVIYEISNIDTIDPINNESISGFTTSNSVTTIPIIPIDNSTFVISCVGTTYATIVSDVNLNNVSSGWTIGTIAKPNYTGTYTSYKDYSTTGTTAEISNTYTFSNNTGGAVVSLLLLNPYLLISNGSSGTSGVGGSSGTSGVGSSSGTSGVGSSSGTSGLENTSGSSGLSGSSGMGMDISDSFELFVNSPVDSSGITKMGQLSTDLNYLYVSVDKNQWKRIPYDIYVYNITTGRFYTSVNRSDFINWSWGDNTYGQLGNNNSLNYLTPVSILGEQKIFFKIKSGEYHTIGLDKNGQVWSWGQNTYAQLGNNSTTNRSTPVSILGTKKTFCKIGVGQIHTIGIDKNGQVWGWGYNNVGQLGNNTITSRRTPVSILGTKKTFCQVGCGYNYTIGLDKDGQVWGWGNNGTGQLGNNSTTTRCTPVSIFGTKKTFCEISCGQQHTIGIDKNGQVWGWGDNIYGQLGDNSVTNRSTPVSIHGINRTFCQISCGYYHTMGIDKNGQVWSWGYNNSGQLGNDSVTSRRTPVSILGTKKTFCEISCGQQHTIGIDKNGQVWGWGDNNVGQLGLLYIGVGIIPNEISGQIKTFSHINGGNGHSIGIDKNGQVWGWGLNNRGQIGDNSTTTRCTPVSIFGTKKTFCQINSYGYNSIGIDNYGQIWSWGLNNRGQIGDNNTTNRCTPVSIFGTKKTFCQINCGNEFMISIDKNAQVWCWGYNNVGQLGNNSTINYSTPVSILGTKKTFCQISSGYAFTIGIDYNGLLWGWGVNNYGQLGDNSTINRSTPVSILGTKKTFCQIISGSANSTGLDNYGQVWCWGYNNAGQLGDNSTTNRSTPVSIHGIKKTFCQIGGKGDYSIGIDYYGQIWSWGINQDGQLGDNSTTNRSTPVSIHGIKKTFCKIGTTQYHILAIDNYGKVWSWGRNNLFELGRDTFLRTPIKITYI